MGRDGIRLGHRCVSLRVVSGLGVHLRRARVEERQVLLELAAGVALCEVPRLRWRGRAVDDAHALDREPPARRSGHRQRSAVGGPVIGPRGLERVEPDAPVRARRHTEVLLVLPEVAGPRVHAVVGQPVHPVVTAADRTTVVHDVVAAGRCPSGAGAAAQDVDHHVVLEEIDSLVGDGADDALADARYAPDGGRLCRDNDALRAFMPLRVEGGDPVIVGLPGLYRVVEEEREVVHRGPRYTTDAGVRAVYVGRAVDLVGEALRPGVPGQRHPEAEVLLPVEHFDAGGWCWPWSGVRSERERSRKERQEQRAGKQSERGESCVSSASVVLVHLPPRVY